MHKHISTTSRTLLNLKVILKDQGRCAFYVHDITATRGQYLALSKAWRACNLLCGRPGGRITSLARPSVRLSVPYGSWLDNEKAQKDQNWRERSPREN